MCLRNRPDNCCRSLRTMSAPHRIVSLLPSATEILFALGVGDNVIGVTFECDTPAEARTRRIVSTSAIPDGLTPGEIDAIVRERTAAGEDLYHLERDALADLNPDLIVTQDLCAVCALDTAEVTDALAHLGCTSDVVSLDPRTLDEVLDTVATLGAAVGRADVAATIIANCRAQLGSLASRMATAPTRRVLIVEWCTPVFGAGHWIPELVVAAGGEPVLAAPGAHSHPLSGDEVRACGAEIVIVAPCGFNTDGAADQARSMIDAGALPTGADVWAIDADHLIVRPSPALVQGAQVLAQILHPDIAGTPAPEQARFVGRS